LNCGPGISATEAESADTGPSNFKEGRGVKHRTTHWAYTQDDGEDKRVVRCSCGWEKEVTEPASHDHAVALARDHRDLQEKRELQVDP